MYGINSPSRSGAAHRELRTLRERGYPSALRSASGCAQKSNAAFERGLIKADATVMLLARAAPHPGITVANDRFKSLGIPARPSRERPKTTRLG
jgi:hypothetical protein